ncbi:MAG: condensation domain-containing protein, partial [Gammaproteobacteria bacterium]|nr:condensation domain-containing protein [Gammaproteobacteria bacterium]
MSAAALIKQLHDLGVRVRLVDGDLKVKAPKGTLTKELQLELKANKAELIEFLSTASNSGKAASPAISPAPDGVTLLPSFSQQRLWFLDQLEPGSAVYNIPFVLRLKGGLQIDSLEGAFNDLVARHEVLRTRFDASNNEDPILLIDEQRHTHIDLISMSKAND